MWWQSATILPFILLPYLDPLANSLGSRFRSLPIGLLNMKLSLVLDPSVIILQVTLQCTLFEPSMCSLYFWIDYILCDCEHKMDKYKVNAALWLTFIRFFAQYYPQKSILRATLRFMEPISQDLVRQNIEFNNRFFWWLINMISKIHSITRIETRKNSAVSPSWQWSINHYIRNLGLCRHFETITNIRTWIKSHGYWRML